MSSSDDPANRGTPVVLTFPPIAERWLAAAGVRRKEVAAAARAPDAASDLRVTDETRLRVFSKRVGGAGRPHDLVFVTHADRGVTAVIAALRLDPEESAATPLDRLAGAMERFGNVVVVASRRARLHTGQTVLLPVALPVERVVTVVTAPGATAIDCHVVRLEIGPEARLHVSLAMSLDAKAYGDWLARRPWR